MKKPSFFAYRAASWSIKNSARLVFVWMTAEIDNGKYAIWCVQAISGNTHTSIKAGGQTFYPPHVALPQLQKTLKRLRSCSVQRWLPLSGHNLAQILNKRGEQTIL